MSVLSRSRKKARSVKMSVSDKGSSDEENKEEFFGVAGHGALDKMVSKTFFQLKKVIEKKKKAYTDDEYNQYMVGSGGSSLKKGYPLRKNSDLSQSNIINDDEINNNNINIQDTPKSQQNSNINNDKQTIKALKLDEHKYHSNGGHSNHNKHRHSSNYFSKHHKHGHHNHNRHHSHHIHKSKHHKHGHHSNYDAKSVQSVPNGHYYDKVTKGEQHDTISKAGSAPAMPPPGSTQPGNNHEQMPYIYDGHDNQENPNAIQDNNNNNNNIQEMSTNDKEKLKIKLPSNNIKKEINNGRVSPSNSISYDAVSQNTKNTKKQHQRRKSNSMFKGFVNNLMHDVVDNLYDDEEVNHDPEFQKINNKYNGKYNKHHYKHGNSRSHHMGYGKHHHSSNGKHLNNLYAGYYNPNYSMLFPYYQSSNHSDRGNEVSGYASNTTMNGNKKHNKHTSTPNVQQINHGQFQYPNYFNPYMMQGPYIPYPFDPTNPNPNPNTLQHPTTLPGQPITPDSVNIKQQQNENDMIKKDDKKENDLAIVVSKPEKNKNNEKNDNNEDKNHKLDIEPTATSSELISALGKGNKKKQSIKTKLKDSQKQAITQQDTSDEDQHNQQQQQISKHNKHDNKEHSWTQHSYTPSYTSDMSSASHSDHSSQTNYGLMQDWDNHARKRAVGWYELFTDLIFVTVIIKMSDMYKYLWYGKYQDNWFKQAIFLFETFTMHIAFFTIWLEMAVIQTRFTSKKPFFGLMKYVYFAGAVTMCMQITSGPPSETSIGFCYGLLVCCISHVLIHIHLCGIPRATLYALINICVMLMSIATLIVGIFVHNATVRMVLILIACLIIYWRTSNTFQVNAMQIPVNVHHFAERFGLFMMIYIGESIIAILLPDGNFDFEHYAMVHLGFLNIYILRFIYFNLAHASCKHEGDSHALRNAGKPGSIAFVNAHLLLSFFLLLEAVGEKMMIKNQEKGKLYEKDAYFFIGAHTITQLIMLFIRHTHQRVRVGCSPYIHLFLRVILTIVLFISLPKLFDSALILLGVCVIITGVLALFDAVFVSYLRRQQAPKNEDSHFFDYGEEMKTIRQYEDFRKANNIKDTVSGLNGFNTTEVNPINVKNNKNFKKNSVDKEKDKNEIKKKDSHHSNNSNGNIEKLTNTKHKKKLSKDSSDVDYQYIKSNSNVAGNGISNGNIINNSDDKIKHQHSHRESAKNESPKLKINKNDDFIYKKKNSNDKINDDELNPFEIDIDNDSNDKDNNSDDKLGTKVTTLQKQESIIDKLQTKSGALGNISRELKKRQSIHNLTRGLPTNIWVNAPLQVKVPNKSEKKKDKKK